MNHAQTIHSINFGLFILFHQLTSSKLSYFVQTCQLARMASTWTEILAKIILHSFGELASGGFPHCSIQINYVNYVVSQIKNILNFERLNLVQMKFNNYMPLISVVFKSVSTEIYSTHSAF